MKTVTVRNITIGAGVPKICVPIVGTRKEEILGEARAITELPADIVEWRADWFADVFRVGAVCEVLKSLRQILGERPLLFTFRTENEGGERSIEKEEYAKLLLDAALGGCADLIDVEAFMSEGMEELIDRLHKAGVKVVGSNHDFSGTPGKDEIVGRLRKMQAMEVDIPKIAVMPRSRSDVLVLLQATAEMTEQYADRPIVTMSMAGIGVVSRVCGEVFGSAMTFGAAGKASAPGQPDVRDLKEMLRMLHTVSGRGGEEK